MTADNRTPQPDWESLTTVVVAGPPPSAQTILNMSRSSAYRAAWSGALPTIKVNGRLRVSTAVLKRILDGETLGPDAA